MVKTKPRDRRPQKWVYRGWPVDAVGLVSLLAFLLIVFQYTSAPILVSTLGRRWDRMGEYLEFLASLGWRGGDLLLLGLILATFLTILVLDLATGRFTIFLRLVFSDERRAIVFTAFCCLVAVRFYFGTGKMPWGADASYHGVYTWIAANGFREGLVPVWTPLLSVGTWFVQFYGFTYAYVSGIVAAILDDVPAAIKLVIGVSHAASGVTCYLFVRTLTRSRASGFVAGLAYVLTFWHIQLVMIMGRYPVGIFFALLPLPFYAIERLRGPSAFRPLHIVLGGIWVALLAFTHPGYAFWAFFFLLIRLAFLFLDRTNGSKAPIRAVVAMLLFGLTLSAYLLVPMWLDRDMTGLYKGFSLTHQPAPTLTHLFAWSNHHARIISLEGDDRHWYGGYIGLSLALLAMAGYLVRARRLRFNAHRDYPLVGLILSALLVLGSQIPIVKSLGVVQAHTPARFLVFVVFFLSVVVGVGYRYLNARTGNRTAFTTILVTLLLVDLGPQTFEQPYHYTDDATSLDLTREIFDQVTGYRHHLDEDQFVSQRVMFNYSVFNNVLTMLAGSATSHGLFEEHPRADIDFIRPFMQVLSDGLGGTADEVRSFVNSGAGRLGSQGLYLLNTRHYLRRNRSVKAVHVEQTNVFPVIISATLAKWDADLPTGSIDRSVAIIEKMEPDLEYGRCARIFVDEPALVRSLAQVPFMRALGQRVWVDRAEIAFELTSTAFCRLSYGYYPGLDIRLDGQSADYFRTTDGFIGMEIPSGRHRVDITGKRSPLRKALLIVNVILMITATCWVYLAKRARTRSLNGR